MSHALESLRPIAAAALSGYTLPRDGIHGCGHWLRVLTNARKLAAMTFGADVQVCEQFALLHDCRRRDDGIDREHGQRAARYVQKLARGGRLGLDPTQVELLAAACARHELGEVSSDPTIGACWDADRLELSRLNRRPWSALLSTEAAKLPDIQAAAWHRGTTQFVDHTEAEALGIEP